MAGISGKLLDMTAWLVATLVVRMEEPKSILFLHFTPSVRFSSGFPATTNSSGCVSWVGFVLGGEGNPLDMVEWSVVHRAGRTKAGKLVASICC